MTSAGKASEGMADRYASALFDLAEADSALDQCAGELNQIQAMLAESPDLLRMIRSPVIARDDQGKAMAAVLGAAGFSDLVKRFVGVLAVNRRLFALPEMIRSFQRKLAAYRGETAAEVVSAAPLSEGQLAALSDALRGVVGTKVTLATIVDPDVIGGLVVKVGSRMVDSSLRSKLNRMRLAMKGIG